MTLPGIDPADPTPGHRRNLVAAAGESSGESPEYKVLLFGNKTSAGSETVDTLGTFISSDADARARMGIRSELYGMYLKFLAVDPGAEMYFIAVTESGGTAATASFTFGAGPATGVTTVKVHAHGEDFEVTVQEGDTASEVADNVRTALANAAEGTLQLVGGGLSPAVSVTYIHNGPRGDLVIGATAATGVRMSFKDDVGLTVAKGALTPGATPDDGAAAFAAAAAGEFTFWVLPWHATAAINNADGQIGEAIAGTNGVKTMYLPINGKEQTVHVGLVGTQAQATAVATSAAANTELAYFYRSENDDWSPAMIAAHHAAIVRSLTVQHPAMFGAVGYRATTTQVYNVRDKFTKADRPTAAEIKADLNNGVTPIAIDDNGIAYIPRVITSRSLNSAGNSDYKAREGHITFVIFFYWSVVESIYGDRLQPAMAGNLAEGEKPFPLTTTPADVEDILKGVIKNLAGRTPLGNRFRGPILAPDKVAKMLAKAKAKKITGGFSAEAEILAVEHLIKSETTVREVSPAY